MIAFFLAVLFAIAPAGATAFDTPGGPIALDTPGGPVGMTHSNPPDRHH
jgi:hypothetical protein